MGGWGAVPGAAIGAAGGAGAGSAFEDKGIELYHKCRKNWRSCL